MIVESILALLAFNAPAQAPGLVRPYASHEQCLVEAEKLNRSEPQLRDKAGRELGLEFVCLKVSRVSV